MKFIKKFYKQVMVIAVIPWSFIPILLAPDARGAAWWLVPFFLQCMFFSWLVDIEVKNK